MELTNKQYTGLKIAVSRYKEHQPYTSIAGYAGTGKSTLIKFIIAELGIPNENVAYVSFTGKAAQVLREKGCPNAQTAHKLLYKTFPRNGGRSFVHVPRPDLWPYRLIVVDEISMLPKDMWELLMSHGVHVLALGDPGQLPPIGESNGVLDHPHVFLDEIMRQAAESEIIRLSMSVREGKPLRKFKGTEINIVETKDVVSGMYGWADQIICGKNETRKNINTFSRKLLWNDRYSTLPLEGDKIICLNNDWDIINEYGDALVNGAIGTLHNIHFYDDYLFKTKMMANFSPDTFDDSAQLDINFYDLNMDYQLFLTGESFRNTYPTARIPKFTKLHEFDYGYAITCHKSQGSEYGKVLLFEEVLRRDQHARWLYTGITRAKDKITIVKQY